jgi:signal transduction histidine kinase
MRIAATAAVSSLIGVLVTGALLIKLFQHHAEQQFDAAVEDDVIHIESSLMFDDNGRLHLVTPLETDLYDTRGSGWAWQLEYEGKVLAQSKSLLPGEKLAGSLDTYDYYKTPDGVPSRGMAEKVQIDGLDRPAILRVSGARNGIDADVAAFERIAILSLGAFVAVLVLSSVVQVRYSLRPLRDLTRSIERMRFGEAGPEPYGWPVEVAPLVAELNALQGHNDTLVERGQRQAADLSHTLKTPLAVVQSIAEDVDGNVRNELLAQTRRMRDAIERNLTRVRSAGGTGRRAKVRPVVEDLEFALSRLLNKRGIVLVNQVPESAVFFGVSEDLEEMLGNLLENASKWAHTRIEVGAENVNGRLAIEVADDGPGVPDDQRNAILRRGVRLDEAMPGQGIGLPIVIDIAEVYGGTFTIERSRLSGLSAVLRVPGTIVKDRRG